MKERMTLGAAEDWRTGMQDERLWKILNPVGTALNAAGIVAMMATIPDQTKQIGIAVSLVLAAVSLAMYILFPQYYSLMGKKQYKEAGLTARVKHLDLALLATGMGLLLRGRDFCFLNWGLLILVGVFLGVLLALPLWFCVREVRENGYALGVALLATLVLGGGLAVNGNHHLNFDAPPPAEYTVVKTDRTTRAKGADSYDCIVEIEPGREVRIPIGLADYNRLQPGDTVLICRDTGALGIDYAYYAGE